MSAQEEGSTVIIPDGEKIIYKSELFDVIVRNKHVAKGITRDRYLVAVELLEQDPLLQRVALLDIAQDVWKELQIGEKAKARLYELPDKTWSTKPPVTIP